MTRLIVTRGNNPASKRYSGHFHSLPLEVGEAMRFRRGSVPTFLFITLVIGAAAVL